MVKVNIFSRYNHRWFYFLLVRRLTCPPTVNTLVKNSLYGWFVVLHVKCSTSYPVPSISVWRCHQHTIALMPVSNELWDAAMGAGWTCYRKRRHGFGMMSSDLLERRDCQENCWQVPYLFLCSCSTLGRSSQNRIIIATTKNYVALYCT